MGQLYDLYTADIVGATFHQGAACRSATFMSHWDLVGVVAVVLNMTAFDPKKACQEEEKKQRLAATLLRAMLVMLQRKMHLARVLV